MAPLVSVCIPTYNGAQFLPQAIDSTLAQTFADFELIIIDNCSSDNTKELVKRYLGLDRRIRFYVNDQNVGMVNNWNLCLEKAEGKFIKYICADDAFFGNDALGNLVETIEADPRLSLVASARHIIDEQGKVQKTVKGFPVIAHRPGPEVIRDCLLQGRNRIGEISSVIFRRNQAGRGFDRRQHHSADLEMFFHLLEQGDFAYIDEPLTCFRQHAQQQTVAAKTVIKDSDVLASSSLVKNYYNSEKLQLSPFQRQRILYRHFSSLYKKTQKGLIERDFFFGHLEKEYGINKFRRHRIIFKMVNLILK